MVTLLLKGGDPADPNNYRPISRLSVLAEVFESLINDQLKQYLSVNNILQDYQSGFRMGHSTITAATLVSNDIITSLDSKKSCAALFIDLSKAFDLADHKLTRSRSRWRHLDRHAIRLWNFFACLCLSCTCTTLVLSAALCQVVKPCCATIVNLL